MTMTSKKIIRTATALAVACSALVGYVKWQWPQDVKELNIPAGRVMTMPGGGNIKGICTQGDPNGLSLWYRVTPLTSNEVAQQTAMFEAIEAMRKAAQ